MPVYCYERGQEVVEKVFAIGEAPHVIKIGGREFKRSYSNERVGVPPTKGWPLECYASGVHPNQAQQLREHFVKVGVPTEVSKDGNPIYRDSRHRKRALKARGFCDRSSFS